MQHSIANLMRSAKTLGEMADPTPNRTVGLEGRHTIVDGCQWARICEECPWVDCVLGNDRCDYDSDRAKEIRSAVKASTSRSKQAIRKRPKINIGYRRMQIVAAKRAGMSESETAAKFGVHIRTVRRAVEWVEGLSDKPWGRHR